MKITTEHLLDQIDKANDVLVWHSFANDKYCGEWVSVAPIAAKDMVKVAAENYDFDEVAWEDMLSNGDPDLPHGEIDNSGTLWLG